MRSSDGLFLFGVKMRIFIPEKVVTFLELGCYHLIFSNGCWGLDMCSRLIGGLRVRIVWVSFFWNMGTSLTTATRLRWLQHVPDNCGASLPVVTVHGMWPTSCNCI